MDIYVVFLISLVTSVFVCTLFARMNSKYIKFKLEELEKEIKADIKNNIQSGEWKKEKYIKPRKVIRVKDNGEIKYD